jgi:signal transduction histidine kinase
VAGALSVRRGEARDTEEVLQTLTWMMRLFGLVAVGLSTFDGTRVRGSQLTVEIVTYAVAALATGVWALIDRSRASRQRYVGLLPYVLAVLTVAAATGAVAKGGWSLIFLGLMATAGAGGDLGIVTSWTIVGLGTIAAESSSLAYHADTWSSLGYPLLLVVGLLIGHSRRAYRIQAEQSAALVAQLQQLQEERSRTATLDERTRIAREIHDVLAHSLGALGVQIQAARAVLTDQHDAERTIELLDQAQRMATDGLRETRRAVHALRSDTPPLPDGLAELSAAHERRHQAEVTLEVSGQPRPLSPDAGLALTRTAQEALVNTAKHAPHLPVEVHLDYGEDRTTLAVINPLGVDGRHQAGFATLNSGYGLAGLRERLLLIDGTLEAGPDGDRWVVTAKVPQ